MKKTYIIVAAVVLAIIIGIVLLRQNNASPFNDTSTGARNTPATVDATPATTTPPAGTKVTPKGALTYEDALALYVGKRYQFDNCTSGPPIVSPGSLSLKVGSKFMLDNRDTDAHTIKVGTQSYRIGKNGFAIATAPAARGTYNITCDGGGQAQLLVQP